MILRAFGITILAIAFVALTVASWQVGGMFLLSAVIAGSVYAIWQVATRTPSPPPEEEPPAVQEEPPEPQPKLWTPRPRARGDEPDAP